MSTDRTMTTNGAARSGHRDLVIAGRGVKGGLAATTLVALGVVFGDIGTSPLYAFRVCFGAGLRPEPADVMGLLSLFIWSLTLIVTVKYVWLVMRADNHGEGGILALTALAVGNARHPWLVGLGLFGAGLLAGDGVITPAISVAGAVEGLEVATEHLRPLVVPITVAILIGLFAVQWRGAGRLGAVFGPVILLWFVALGALGLPWIVQRPEVLTAVNPLLGLSFLLHHGSAGFFVLGAVVLAVTGCEALYADMGHVGRRPIQVGWLLVAFPALALNYFGQGALLLVRPEAAANPFFAMAPPALLLPLVALATFAAVIASQALISGTFSLAHQAVQLGYLPRLHIKHTSEQAAGQVYVPAVNLCLGITSVAVVLGFGSSTALAGAYGVAVTGVMVITTLLIAWVCRHRWNWSRPAVVAVIAAFLTIDVAFFLACIRKVGEGGWLPLAVGLVGFIVMANWRACRAEIGRRTATPVSLEVLVADVGETEPVRVRGTAVFLNEAKGLAPGSLLHHFKHNQVLHDRVVLLTVITEPVPEVPAASRVTVQELGEGFWEVVAHYGFRQIPNVPRALRRCATAGLVVNPAEASYYLGRQTYHLARSSRIARWRRSLFILMARNAQPASDFFGIPPDRLVEVGRQLEV